MDLKAFAHKSKKLFFAEPFTLVDRESKVWNCASDRVWFLASKGKGQYLRWPGNGEDMNRMLGFIHLPSDKPHQVKVEDLVAWVDETEVKEGVVLGVVVTLARLKTVVETAPLKTIEMWKATKMVEDERCLAFQVDGRWRAVLMGHEIKPDKLPAFDLQESEMSGFDLAMSLG